MGLRLLPLLVIVTAALLVPASAWAATGALDGTTMVYTAAQPETNNAVVTLVDQNGSPYYQVYDPGAKITATTPCLDSSDGAPNDNTMVCPQNLVASFRASLGDGDDSISIQAALPTSIGAGGGNDTMTGGPAADYLRGGQNSDTISGGGGNDQLIGDDADPTLGGGNDTLNGGAGDDSVDGENGDDSIRGGIGDDSLAGGTGNDTFSAEAVPDGIDVYAGGDGSDTVSFADRNAGVTLSIDGVANDGQIGATGDNILTDVENLQGGPQADILSGSDVANVLDGGAGDDALTAGEGDDTLTGGDGNDTADGGNGNDGFTGGDGADTLSGGGGNDIAAGGTGNDTLVGGDGGDTLMGDADSDTLSGDAGQDSLAGGDGNDALDGGGEGDALDGGSGDDVIDGGAGPDTMAGGIGTDLGNYGSRNAGVTVTLDGQPGDGEPGENDNVQTDVENLRGGSGADTFIGSAAANALDGGAGEDYSDGGAGADTLIGGDSGDVLRTRGSADGDTVQCGPGPDFVVAKPADNVSPDCDRVDRGVNQRPKLRDSAVVAPAVGALQMSPTGIVRRVPLLDTVVLPLRSIVDTLAGAVRVTSALSARKAQTITLDSGAFDITQTAAKLAVTQFALQGGDFTGCPVAARGTGARSAAAGKTIRKLWATGKGKFRTRGRYAAAAIRGTRWLTEDRCDGTLIRVTAGAVAVQDLVTKKTVLVKAGGRYFAAATRASRRPR